MTKAGELLRLLERKITKEEFDAWDLSPLEKELSSKLGTTITLTSKGLQNGYPEIVSQDLTAHIGVMKSGIEKIWIHLPNFEVGADGDKTYYWAVWNFRFELKDRGSNGISLLTSWYYPDTDKWEFKWV